MTDATRGPAPADTNPDAPLTPPLADGPTTTVYDAKPMSRGRLAAVLRKLAVEGPVMVARKSGADRG